jgi:Flp pilus assembly protein TadB
MSLYGAVVGVVAAAGVWLAVAGWFGAAEPVRRSRSVEFNAAVLAPRLAIGVCAFAVVWFVTGWPAAAAALAGVAVMGTLFVDAHRQRRRAMERTEALAAWAEMLRGSIAAHAGLNHALTSTAAVAPAAIGPEVRRLSIRAGQMPLGDALRLFAVDMADPVADLIVAALTISDRHQARNLPSLLGEIAASTRELASMRQRVETGRARTYASARSMVAITMLMVVVLMLFSPDFMEPYDAAGGQVVMLIAGALFVGAVWALIQMSRPIAQPRMLVGVEEELAGEALR